MDTPAIARAALLALWMGTLTLPGAVGLAASPLQEIDSVAEVPDGVMPDPDAPNPGASPAVYVADSERDFDRLDREAGLRSGGPFSFDYQHLVYYQNQRTPGETNPPVTLWTAASVQADRVHAVFDKGWKYSLDMTVELLRDDTVAYTTQSRTTMTLTMRLDERTAAGKGFPLYARTAVAPGRYDYRILIRDNGWDDDRGVNEKTGSIVVPNPVDSKPFLSSIAIAADSAGSWTPDPSIDLQLNAARMVQTDARPYVYFEAYGLTPGGDYRGEVRLVSRWVSRGQGESFEGSYQPFQLQYRGSVPTNPNEPVRKVLRMDLDQTAAGPYEVQIRVRDLTTGQVSEVRTARMKVRAPDRYTSPNPIVEVRDSP
ncbi:MAG: hypothetical protein ACR2GQ_08965 [Gemmatimonadota bacterium]